MLELKREREWSVLACYFETVPLFSFSEGGGGENLAQILSFGYKWTDFCSGLPVWVLEALLDGNLLAKTEE